MSPKLAAPLCASLLARVLRAASTRVATRPRVPGAHGDKLGSGDGPSTRIGARNVFGENPTRGVASLSRVVLWPHSMSVVGSILVRGRLRAHSRDLDELPGVKLDTGTAKFRYPDPYHIDKAFSNPYRIVKIFPDKYRT